MTTEGQPAAPAASPAPAQAPANAAPGGAVPYAEQQEAPGNGEAPAFDTKKAGLVFLKAEGERPAGYYRPVKVDGETHYVDVYGDWADVRHSRAAQKRMTEADKKSKDAETKLSRLDDVIRQRLEADPDVFLDELLSNYGMDPKEYRRRAAERRDRLASMTPEQRATEQELEEGRAARAKLSESEAREKKIAEAAAIRESMDRSHRAMQTAMPAAGLDYDDPYHRLAMVSAMRASYMKNPNAPQNYDEIATRVRGALRRGMGKTLSGVPDPELLDMVGDKDLARIHRLAAERAQRGAGGGPTAQPPAPGERRSAGPAAEPREYRTPGEAIAAFKKKNGGKLLGGL